MEIGFGGFVNVIDALGGIRMCLPDAIKDRDSHLKKLTIGTMGSRKGKHEICENRFCGPQGKRD
jgi:anionic cell wall polymer biosynthesis LytR-Cps2A-Psr (LCP) family protein